MASEVVVENWQSQPVIALGSSNVKTRLFPRICTRVFCTDCSCLHEHFVSLLHSAELSVPINMSDGYVYMCIWMIKLCHAPSSPPINVAKCFYHFKGPLCGCTEDGKMANPSIHHHHHGTLYLHKCFRMHGVGWS